MTNQCRALPLLAFTFILGYGLIATQTAHADDCTLSVMIRGPVSESPAATQALLKAVQEQGYVLKKDPAEATSVLYVDSFANGWMGSRALIELTLIRKEEDAPNAWLNGTTPQVVEWKSVWTGKEKTWAQRAQKAILGRNHAGIPGLPQCDKLTDFAEPTS